MDIKISEVSDISIVSIIGSILQEDVHIFKAALLDLLKKGKIKIILDMQASNYISSICLASIIDVKKRVSGLGGDLKLSRPNKIIRNLLESTVLIRKIDLYPDLDTAIKSFDASR